MTACHAMAIPRCCMMPAIIHFRAIPLARKSSRSSNVWAVDGGHSLTSCQVPCKSRANPFWPERESPPSNPEKGIPGAVGLECEV
jgi:hypothetical protein